MKFCGILLLVQIAGCSGGYQIQREPRPATFNFTFDAGKVIAGQKIVHDFKFENESDEQLVIRENANIQERCGCSSITPATKTLKPHSSTTVRVSVHTRNRDGKLSATGEIQWSTPTGKKIPTRFTIKTEVKQPFRFEPSLLVFSADDIRGNKTKQLTIKSNLPIDWDTLRISSSSSHLRVHRVMKDEGHAQCLVKYRMPDGLQSSNDILHVNAAVSEKADVLAGELVTGRVHTNARQTLRLVVQPSILTVALSPSDGSGTARLLLRGEALRKSENAIKSVACPGFKIEWQATKPNKDTASTVLRIRLTPKQVAADSRAELEIQIADIGKIKTPIILVDAPDTRRAD